MFDSFDHVKINAVCTKCGYENRKTVRQLRAERSFGCFACGMRISTEDPQIRRALSYIDRVRDEVTSAMENRSIVVR